MQQDHQPLIKLRPIAHHGLVSAPQPVARFANPLSGSKCSYCYAAQKAANRVSLSHSLLSLQLATKVALARADGVP